MTEFKHGRFRFYQIYLFFFFFVIQTLFSKIFPWNRRSKRTRDGQNKHAISARNAAAFLEKLVDFTDRRLVFPQQYGFIQFRFARQTD